MRTTSGRSILKRLVSSLIRRSGTFSPLGGEKANINPCCGWRARSMPVIPHADRWPPFKYVMEHCVVAGAVVTETPVIGDGMTAAELDRLQWGITGNKVG